MSAYVQLIMLVVLHEDFSSCLGTIRVLDIMLQG